MWKEKRIDAFQDDYVVCLDFRLCHIIANKTYTNTIHITYACIYTNCRYSRSRLVPSLYNNNNNNNNNSDSPTHFKAHRVNNNSASYNSKNNNNNAVGEQKSHHKA